MNDKELIRRCRCLAKQSCANMHDGWCLPDDRPCYVINPRYSTIHDGAIDCDYFRLAVLPADDDLHKLVKQEIFREDVPDQPTTRLCVTCGCAYIPASPRQKYCTECGLKAKRQRNREKQQRYNERNRTKGIV